MKEHHEDGINRQKMHDRRRRKFLREYDTMQSKLSYKQFEEDLVNQLLNECKSEKVENRRFEKVINYRKVIMENRSNRNILMDQMDQNLSIRKSEWEKVEFQRESNWVVDLTIDSQSLRRQTLNFCVSAANRQQSNEIVLDIIDKLFDMTDWVISCRQIGLFDYKILHESGSHSGRGDSKSKSEQKIISTILFEDALNMFTADFNLAESLPLPQPIQVSSALGPFSISQRF
jgi:hypothetical protein